MPPESQAEGGGSRLSRKSAAIRAVSSLLFSLVLALSYEGVGLSQIQVFFDDMYVAYNSADPGCQLVKAPAESVSYARTGVNAPATIQFSPETTGADKPSPPNFNYPGSCVSLCTQIGYNNETGGDIPVDSLVVEVFKFLPGANPLDPGSTPPIRTFTFSAIGIMRGANTLDGGAGSNMIPTRVAGSLASRCVGWDGSYNVEGEFGRTNGQFGFRATASTNRQTPQQGNITITTSPPGIYPGVEKEGVNDHLQSPLSVDVVDFHVVRTTPTTVGARPTVAVEPYNVKYRLSKDAVVSLDIFRCDATSNCNTAAAPVRRVVHATPRVGEGIPNGALTNGDFWDGRDAAGSLLPPGHYLMKLTASATDTFGADTASPVTRQLAIDPLQVTDIVVAPLGDLSTSLATLSYLLTEDATVYVDIYPPGTTLQGNSTTTFAGGVDHDFNDAAPSIFSCSESLPDGSRLPSSCLDPRVSTGASVGAAVHPVRTIREQKPGRVPLLTFWDGRDTNGAVVPDGNYVFAIYASLPSVQGSSEPVGWPVRSVWTSRTQTGVIAVSRGNPTITQVTPRTTVVGSSPAVAGLDPFSFSYAINRDALVSLVIYRATDTSRSQPIKTLVNRETRQPGFTNVERWVDGRRDDGRIAAAGDYVAELSAADAFFPAKVSTVSASFPLSLYRMTDISDTALLSGATDRVFLSYQPSKPMQVTWSVFPPGSQVRWTDSSLPPCQATASPVGGCPDVVAPDGVTPVSAVYQSVNFRPGRLRVQESWDGRVVDTGVILQDGVYPYTVVAKTTDTVAGSPYATDRVIGTITIARGQIIFPAFAVLPTLAQVFNSSEVVTLPPFEVDYSLTRQSSVTVQVLTTTLPQQVVANVLAGGIREPQLLNREFWDGRDNAGNFVPAGVYTVRVIARDVSAQLISPATFQQNISVDPLQIYDVAISPITLANPNATISYQVSESMKVAVKIYKPGTTFDPQGNPQPPEATSLERVLVGVKPARTEIKDFWDGKDLKGSLAPDGNYIFKIVASTDVNAIDSITGNVAPGAARAQGSIVSELPVTRGASADPDRDFETNTFVYPNPVAGVKATIQMRVPLRANLSVRIYNIAGELVKRADYADQPPDSYVNLVWNRDNDSGRKVAKGVYLVVIREESMSGDRQVFQAVKKVLLQ